MLLLLLAMVALTGCDKDVEITPPAPGRDVTDSRAEGAQEVLDRLVEALRDGSRHDAVATATENSRDLLGAVADNAADLRIDELSMRYIDEGSPLGQREQAEFGPEAWRGTVQLTYRYEGLDRRPARIETSVAFVQADEGIRIAVLGGAGSRTPLWVTGRVSVVRTARTLVAVAGPSAGRYPALLRGAVRQVTRVLPGWRGPLLVEVPDTQEDLDQALDTEPGRYDNIAAVTTTADGSLAPTSPVRVFVNPAVFDGLQDRGAQVVISHEATHVATGATFVTMPTWLLEGFADFVALDRAGIPVDLAAGQILARVRADGPPDGLPTRRELDPTANGLGATYEEAWLACRFLAQEYGTAAMVRFYDTVKGGTSTQRAFREELDTTQRAFVERWRDDVAALAGVAG